MIQKEDTRQTKGLKSDHKNEIISDFDNKANELYKIVNINTKIIEQLCESGLNFSSIGPKPNQTIILAKDPVDKGKRVVNSTQWDDETLSSILSAGLVYQNNF